MKKLLFVSLLLLLCVFPTWAVQVNLTWNPPTTYVDGTPVPVGTVIQYNVYRGNKADLSDAVVLTTVSGGPNYVDTTVTVGKIYYYFLRAYINPAYVSGNSNTASAALLSPQPPTGVIGVIVP